jgi:hypothetical protein
MPVYLPSQGPNRANQKTAADELVWKIEADSKFLSGMNADPFVKNYLKDWEKDAADQRRTEGAKLTALDLERIHNVAVNATPFYVQKEDEILPQSLNPNKVAIIQSADAVSYLSDQLEGMDPLLKNHIINNLHQQGLSNIAGNFLGSKLLACQMDRIVDQINIHKYEDGSVTVQTFSLLNKIKDLMASGDPENPVIYQSKNPKQPLARVDMEVRLSTKDGKVDAEITEFKILGQGAKNKSFFDEKIGVTPKPDPTPNKSRQIGR